MICKKCKRDIPREAFTPNPQLENGVSPWCNDCLHQLLELQNNSPPGSKQVAEEKAKYRNDYQSAYHSVYRQRHGKTKLKGRRSIQRLTKAMTQQIFDKRLSVTVFRREEAQAEWMHSLPHLRETPTWQQFEEEVIANSGREEEKDIFVFRILPEEIYPEFSLVEGNCITISPGEQGAYDVHLSAKNVQEGWDRLIQCISEAQHA